MIKRQILRVQIWYAELTIAIMSVRQLLTIAKYIRSTLVTDDVVKITFAKNLILDFEKDVVIYSKDGSLITSTNFLHLNPKGKHEIDLIMSKEHTVNLNNNFKVMMTKHTPMHINNRNKETKEKEDI